MSAAGLIVSAAALKTLVPTADRALCEKLAPEIQAQLPLAGVATERQLAHFLAQAGHECGFRVLAENLNYRAAGLLQTFPRYFDHATALAYQQRPEAIASRVYANRMGNGPEPTGDGWRYRGRGIVHLTGFDNYRRYGELLRLPLLAEPHLAAEPKHAAAIYARFWAYHDLSRFAEANAVRAVTKVINGGANGLAERVELTRRAETVLAVVQLQAALNRAQAGAALALDGDYGKATRTAVAAFQGAHRLDVDGIAGPNTRKALGLA